MLTDKDFAVTEVTVWQERDRAHICLQYKDGSDSSDTIVEWWDESAAQAIEDGFLPPIGSNNFHERVLEYAFERGLYKTVEQEKLEANLKFAVTCQGLAVRNYEPWMVTSQANEGDTLAYADLPSLNAYDEVTGEHFVEIDLCTGSDYSGSTGTKANHLWVKKNWLDRPGVFDVWGGHGTYAIVIRIRDLDEEMRDAIAALSDYPCFDDELLVDVEDDLFDEEWKSWAHSEFEARIKSALVLEGLSTKDDDFRLYFKLARINDSEVVFEGGSSVYINFDELIKGVALEDLRYFEIEYETSTGLKSDEIDRTVTIAEEIGCPDLDADGARQILDEFAENDGSPADLEPIGDLKNRIRNFCNPPIQLEIL